MLRVTCDDGSQGTGYSYTIGTGGSSVMALLEDHLAPKLIGREADDIEAIWKELFFHTHATAVVAITALALATVDTALWDLRCRRTNSRRVRVKKQIFPDRFDIVGFASDQFRREMIFE